ncbi:MAG: hypothetical protein IKL21_03745 [Clostridia bacterium]|jgi:hypothetical protein|nr:hypothetical protein [Clostridia bacterium]
MQKSLYSLILSDSVISKIDMLALKQGTNRSNMINMILADYVSLTTPEMHIENVFRQMEQMLSVYDNIVPIMIPNRATMSVKSTLEYKYRPTVKYDIHLYRNIQNGAFGELSVSFRTQSESLISLTEEFFKFWCRLENAYIQRAFKNDIRYYYTDGKFVRTLMCADDASTTPEALADGISSYVRVLDDIMKGTVSGRYSLSDSEEKYVSYLKNSKLMV